MSDTVNDAKNTGSAAGSDALASQKELLAWNLEMNTAMAWIQAAQDLAKKIKG